MKRGALFFICLSLAGMQASPVVASSMKTAVTDTLRAYNAEDYQLAYDTFLGSQDRERAYRVASAAVASQPRDADWRCRLATTSGPCGGMDATPAGGLAELVLSVSSG